MQHPGILPHQNITIAPVHLTYRLADSLPKSTLDNISRRRQKAIDRLEAELTAAKHYDLEFLRREKRFLIDAHYELAIDQALDQLSREQTYPLQQTAIRKLILDSWNTLQTRGVVYCYAICVMGNHVHVVLGCPESIEEIAIDKLIGSHKKFTARRANILLGTTGKAFWNGSYFDRAVRKGKFIRVMWYVLNNPVKAGLVNHWTEWPGTYLNPDYEALFLGK